MEVAEYTGGQETALGMGPIAREVPQAAGLGPKQLGP